MHKPYYQDDLVTLYHGDCLEVTEWTEADVLVTDPPYGVSWKGAAGYNSKGRNPSKNDEIKNDLNHEIRDQVLNIWQSKPALVFGSWRVPRPVKTKLRLIWHKRANLPGVTSHPWFSAEEEIYVMGSGFQGKPTQNVLVTDDRRDGAYGEVARLGHPTPKPVGLLERLIEKCPEGVIADPFAGAGSTLIAARNLGRRAIGVEMEEKYCETIASRLQQQAFDLEGLNA